MKRKRKGSIMALSIILFAILSGLGTVGLGMSINENKRAIRHQAKTQAYYIARSGAEVVEAAILNLESEEEKEGLLKNLPKTINVKGLEFGFDGLGHISLEGNRDKLIIVSEGKVENVIETVEKIINVEINKYEEDIISNIDTTIFSNNNMIFKNNTQNNVNGAIGTNSIISGSLKFDSGFNDKITIKIPVGADSSSIIDKPSYDRSIPKVEYIEKRIYSSPILPAYPENLPERGIIETSYHNDNPIISRNGYYDRLTIKSNRSVTIDTRKGDVDLRIREFDVQRGDIMVTGEGKVNIFIEEFKNFNGNINGEGNSKKFRLYYNGSEPIIIAGSDKINGSLYIEQADLLLTGSGTINGNVVHGGKSLTISGGSYSQNGLIYAPNAQVNIIQGGTIKGAIICNILEMSGGANIEYNTQFLEDPPVISPITRDSINFTPGYYR